MKKQTAVEWLFEKLPTIDKYDPYYADIFQQAKAMEKEQQQEIFKQSRLAKIFEKDMPPIWENFEDYYNETYGN